MTYHHYGAGPGQQQQPNTVNYAITQDDYRVHDRYVTDFVTAPRRRIKIHNAGEVIDFTVRLSVTKAFASAHPSALDSNLFSAKIGYRSTGTDGILKPFANANYSFSGFTAQSRGLNDNYEAVGMINPRGLRIDEAGLWEVVVQVFGTVKDSSGNPRGIFMINETASPTVDVRI